MPSIVGCWVNSGYVHSNSVGSGEGARDEQEVSRPYDAIVNAHGQNTTWSRPKGCLLTTLSSSYCHSHLRSSHCNQILACFIAEVLPDCDPRSIELPVAQYLYCVSGNDSLLLTQPVCNRQAYILQGVILSFWNGFRTVLMLTWCFESFLCLL
jgi:hypothetical protein